MEIFTRLDLVNETNDKIVITGLERLKCTMVDVLIAVLCSAYLGHILVGIIFELSYISVRIYVGGFHAPSESICKYLTYISTILSIVLVFITYFDLEIMNILMAINCCIIILMAPVESSNKPLNQKEHKVFYYKSIVYTLLNVTLYFVLLCLKQVILARTIVIALGLVVVGILLELIRKQFAGEI